MDAVWRRGQEEHPVCKKPTEEVYTLEEPGLTWIHSGGVVQLKQKLKVVASSDHDLPVLAVSKYNIT